MLTVGRSARDLLRKKNGTLAAWSKKKVLPLRLEDGHIPATLSAIVMVLCEGRTGLAISGVFGAGKTRSAAALLAGLLVFDPSLPGDGAQRKCGCSGSC